MSVLPEAHAWLRQNDTRMNQSPLLGDSPYVTLVQVGSVLETVIAQLREDAETPLPPICRYGLAHMLEVAAHAVVVVSDHMDGLDTAASADAAD